LWEPIGLTRNIEVEVVVNGWAWVLDRYGPDARYYKASKEARRHLRGIWARNENIHPWAFKKRMYREAKRGPDQNRQANLFGYSHQA
jgi:endonuclease YncB( thermonuclease family)